ncbi:hypothetical protein CVS40_11239 [Lucilia cuprina]|nr:hypothetical protein CVS40_11239 [Lucilia cuprina]
MYIRFPKILATKNVKKFALLLNHVANVQLHSSMYLKSPQREDTPSLSASSETLKNLILEQFMK